MKYKTLYLDPPWLERGGGKIKRGADKHYELMHTKDILELLKKDIVPLLDDNCHMYMWVTNNFLKDGLWLIEQLGFQYITTITWMKDKIGLGQYYRGLTEHCLFARKGMLPYKEQNGKRLQGVTGFIERKQEHSRKPYRMRKMIEGVSHEPRLEVFSREKVAGWDCYGNETEKYKTNTLMGYKK